MAKQNTAPTMKDVAKEAGVSLGTVSKVINGIPVGDEYRKKVEQAIKTLDYHINAYAKGLKNNRTYTVAVILPNLLNPFFSMVAHYINRALVNRGYRMLLCDTEYDYTKEREMVQMVAQNKVDGIIALTYNPDLKIPPDVRSVSIDRYLSGSTTCVASDNYNGGRLAAQKLVENGCKNLAFLRIGSPLTSETNKRRDGFVAECEAMQLPCTQKILMDDAPLSEFEHFLEENLKDGRLAFDGIFCVTDKLAVAVIKMLRRMGQRVPEDVQVIGYDGLRAFGDQDYYCSTIIQPVEAMAPEHVHQALLEVYRRRQGRGPDDLLPKLRARIVRNIEASGLTREDYAERVRTRDEAANALLDEALTELAAKQAREEALLRAFEASGKSLAEFADMYGMDPRTVERSLHSARQRAAAPAAPAAPAADA